MEAHRKGHSIVPLYPVFDPLVPVARAQLGGEPQPGVDPRAASRSSTTCQGCRHRRARIDWTHNRVIGQCCYPYDVPAIWACEACVNHLPRDRDGQLFEPGRCRLAAVPSRRYAPKVGHQPREPASPSHSDPTVGLPGHARGQHDRREELGVEGEQAALRRAQPTGTGQLQVAEALIGSSASVVPGQIQVQERMRQQIGQVFDIGRTVRSLKVCTEAQARLSLRKLRLRWWHAQTASMTRLVCKERAYPNRCWHVFRT